MQDTQNVQNTPPIEDEISLVDILKFFVKHKNIILITTIVITLLALVKTFFVVQKPTYTCESGIIIIWPEYELITEPKLQLRDIGELYFQQFENRKRSIQELILSPSIIIPVIKKSEEKNLLEKGTLLYSDFVDPKNKMIKISQGGEIIKITVNMPTKDLAKLFSEEIAKNAVEKIKEILSTYDEKKIKKDEFVIKIAYVSDVEEIPAKGKFKNLALSIFVGLFLGIFVAILKEGFEKLKETK